MDATPNDELRKTYRELTSEPYQEIYVEVHGEIGPPPGEGFGAEYNRQLTIYELRRAALEGKGCDEDLSEFRFKARGNEPFWNLTIAVSGVSLSEMGAEPRTYPYATPKTNPDGWVYSPATEGMADPIRVTLRRRRCVDTMSGERFSYEAEVQLHGRSLRGCAYEGEQ